MFAYRQIFLMSRASDRAIDGSKPAAAFFIPFPDLGWYVGISHIV
jgi:hypothetical protein